MSFSRVCLIPRYIHGRNIYINIFPIHCKTTSNRDDNSVPESCQRLCVPLSLPNSSIDYHFISKIIIPSHAHSRHGNINPFPFPQVYYIIQISTIHHYSCKERLTLRQLLLLRNPYPLGQQGFHLSLLLLPSRSVPDHCSTRIHIQASTPQCPQHSPTCLRIFPLHKQQRIRYDALAPSIFGSERLGR